MNNPLRIVAFSYILLLPMPSLSQTVTQVFAYPSNAAGPICTPAQGRDGSLYTTASGDGTTHTNGAILQTPLAMKGTRLLYTFATADGTNPGAGLMLGLDGNYYGAAPGGGSSGYGVLFKITPTGTYTVLHQFTGGSDGGAPVSAPVQASDGNLYGNTSFSTVGAGTIYKFSPPSGTFTTIFTFAQDGSQGKQMTAPLIQASDGNLYGTTELGGASNAGTIYKISTAGVLLNSYNFPGGSGGGFPLAPLVEASDGNLYGTTFYAGTITGQCKTGCGTVFKMSHGTVSVLYSFEGTVTDGAYPEAGLTEGTDGNLYGNTVQGGKNQLGTIYQITTSGQYKLLYSFSAEVGSGPGAALVQHTNGKFYGTAGSGGRNGAGSLYSFDVGLGPFIALVRYTGRIGQPVQILGQGLTGSTSVTINGIAATSFKVVTDRYMTVVIPTEATSGPVVVTTPTATLTSNHNLQIVQ